MSEGDWYVDPSGRYEYRYWNGTSWTRHVAISARQADDDPDSEWPSPAPASMISRVLPAPSSERPKLVDNVIAQAATVIVVLIAIIYACGSIVFFIRLWLLGLPVSAVIGELSHGLLITVGLPEVVLPAGIAGILLYLSLSSGHCLDDRSTRKSAKWRLLVAAAVLGAASATTYVWAERVRLISHVFRHALWPFLAATFFGNLALLAVALWASRKVPTDWSGRPQLRAIAFVVALLPGIAAIPAAGPLPSVWVCRSDGLQPPFLEGDLITSSGGFDYIAQYELVPVPKGQPVAGQRWITVVPQSEVRVTTLKAGKPFRLACASAAKSAPRRGRLRRLRSDPQ